MKNYHYDKSNGIFSENIFLSIDIFFRFLRERITRSDGNLQVTDLDISIVWHRQIAQREDRIRKRPRLICLSIGGRFVFSSSEYPRSRNTTFTPIFLFFLAGFFLCLPSSRGRIKPKEASEDKRKAKKREAGGSIDPFVKRHFPSFSPGPSLFPFSTLQHPHRNLNKAIERTKKKGKKEGRKKGGGRGEFIRWAESRRRPESYVSRIWKGPSFLPGIIENRCRLSLYVDQHSLTTRGKELSSLSPPLLDHRRFHHRETDSSRPLHPSYCYSVTAKTTGSTFHVPLSSLHGRRFSHRYKPWAARRCKGNLKSTR